MALNEEEMQKLLKYRTDISVVIEQIKEHKMTIKEHKNIIKQLEIDGT